MTADELTELQNRRRALVKMNDDAYRKNNHVYLEYARAELKKIDRKIREVEKRTK